jgi:hypothetical protein
MVILEKFDEDGDFLEGKKKAKEEKKKTHERN